MKPLKKLNTINAHIITFLVISFFFSFFQINAQAQENAYIIGPNDVIKITIFAGGEKQYDEEITVSSQGMINAPFIGTIKAEGLTPSELEKEITAPLSKEYFVNPKVNIRLQGSKSKIYVDGEVKKPNAYEFQPGITALNACIMAGGFTTFAAPNRTKIIRKQGQEVEIIKINLNKVKDGKISDIELKPDDRIHVPETWL
ncbi:MAG: polysaccharide export protein [Deltaproteobacteria bacterium]|nr:polysaccharide export protein [Deltaproteobacteria bacterium]